MNKLKSFWIRLMMAVALIVVPLTGHSKESVPWLIYVYMVGSDLESGDEESEGGAATDDLNEMIESSVGKNVKILVQTGGAAVWQNDVVSNEKIEVYEISNGEIELVKDWPNQNMGDKSVLSRFIKFGESKYAPEHRIIIFWDHGGGPLGGVGYDEFSGDFLTLPEISDAFKDAFPNTEKPFDLIGLDVCLMATLDSGYYLTKWGHVLVSSENNEPSIGWYYTPWLDQLEKQPHMSLRQLGKNIVDTYVQGCRENDLEQDVTLSAVSLDNFHDLMLSYNVLGTTIVNKMNSNSNVITQIARAANNSESYGTNSKERKSYTDSIDLGHFVKSLKHIAPSETEAVEKALNKYVLYKYSGVLKKGTGVSTYYPIGKLYDDYTYIYQNGAPTSFNLAFGIQMRALDNNGYNKLVDSIRRANDFLGYMKIINERYAGYVDKYKVSESASTETVTETDYPLTDVLQQVISSANVSVNSVNTAVTAVQQVLTVQKKDISSLEDAKVSFDNDGNSYIQVPKNVLASLSSVELEVMLYELPTKNNPKGFLLYLGSNGNVKQNWDDGKFTDLLDGTWASLDGHFLPLSVANVTDDFITYDCEVKINNVPHNMIIAYDIESKKYGIIGIQKINDSGVPDRVSNSKLKEGDKITTVFYATSLFGDEDEGQFIDLETFTYSKKSKIKDEELGESDVLFAYNFTDSFGNDAMSELVSIAIDDKGKMQLRSWENLSEELISQGKLVLPEDAEENNTSSSQNDDSEDEDDE